MSDTPRTDPNHLLELYQDDTKFQLCQRISNCLRELAACRTSKQLSEQETIRVQNEMIVLVGKLARYAEAEKELDEVLSSAGVPSDDHATGDDLTLVQRVELLAHYWAKEQDETMEAESERDAAVRDAGRHHFAMRHANYYSMEGEFLIDCYKENASGSDAPVDYEKTIDAAISAEGETHD